MDWQMHHNMFRTNFNECFYNYTCRPCCVPSVWSATGPEELAGCDVPVIRLQLKSAEVWGSRPQREPWKVHSRSGGQEPVSLLDTDMSSMTMLPCCPPTTASRINWRRTGIHWSRGCINTCVMLVFKTNIRSTGWGSCETLQHYLYWFVTAEGQISKSPLVSLGPTSHPHQCLRFTRMLCNKLQWSWL